MADARVEDLGFCKRTALDNGVVVMSERMDDVRSVSLGLWMDVGSRDERPEQAGLSHFMEHMTFKGTPTMSAFDINKAFDAMGAESNAFTGKEATCFYARCVDDRLPEALRLFADMVTRSTYAPEAVASERKVVLEEIARAHDTPDDYVFDLFERTMFPHSPVGAPVLGSRELVEGYGHDDCAAFRGEHYTSDCLCVAAAGHVDHERLVSLCQELFGGMGRGARPDRTAAAPERERFSCDTRDIEQAHVVMGVPWLPYGDERRFAGAVVAQLLGGSMSSRLFQKVREERGLVYSVYASPVAYQGAGALAVYAGTRAENVEEVVRLVRQELLRLASDGVEPDELERTVESIAGQTLLAQESTVTRMSRLGRAQTLGGELVSADEAVRRLKAVTCGQAQKLARELLTAVPTVTVVSPLAEEAARAKVERALEE